MNERIKLLAVAAAPANSSIPHSEWNIPKEFIEKFAELIVREMCQVIDADCQLQMRQRVITNLGGLNQAKELIKQHFGVEE